MIRIHNLCKSFGKQKVLRGIKLVINKGSIQGILGANGSGKSTLLKAIADYIAIDAGEIQINNVKISPTEYKYRENVGYLLDEDIVIDRLTAKEYLEFIGSFYTLTEGNLTKRVENLIKFFGLDEGRKKIEDYSTGMRKKVGLAAALVHKPSVLILDEPFEGLDFISSEKTIKLLKNMAINGVTILMTSHIYDVLARTCHYLAVIKDGQIVLNDSFDELTKKCRKLFPDEPEAIQKYLRLSMGKETVSNFDITI